MFRLTLNSPFFNLTNKLGFYLKNINIIKKTTAAQYINTNMLYPKILITFKQIIFK